MGWDVMRRDVMAVCLGAVGESAADGVWRSLPPRAAREKISDRYPDGHLLQRNTDLRGAEWKPNAGAEVPLERDQEELLHRKSCMLHTTYKDILHCIVCSSPLLKERKH